MLRVEPEGKPGGTTQLSYHNTIVQWVFQTSQAPCLSYSPPSNCPKLCKKHAGSSDPSERESIRPIKTTKNLRMFIPCSMQKLLFRRWLKSLITKNIRASDGSCCHGVHLFRLASLLNRGMCVNTHRVQHASKLPSSSELHTCTISMSTLCGASPNTNAFALCFEDLHAHSQSCCIAYKLQKT